jgi:hypothetical protein
MNIPYKHEITKEFLSTYMNANKEIIKITTEVLKDKSIPLDSRWEMYIVIQPLLPIYSWVITLKSIEEKVKNFTWYDDMYLGRYEVQEFDVDFFQSIEEKIEEKEGGWGEVSMDELKEEILQLGIGGFENDW